MEILIFRRENQILQNAFRLPQMVGEKSFERKGIISGIL
jgi:hypothetical protein